MNDYVASSPGILTIPWPWVNPAPYSPAVTFPPVQGLTFDWPPPAAPAVPVREPQLYATIGVQRSGKSTRVRRWRDRLEPLAGEADDGYPRFMWDTDACRLELHEQRYVRAAEPAAYMVKHYAIATALRLGHDVAVAGTHTTKASIRRILEIRRDAAFILVDTPLETCIDRAYATGQCDLVPVIRRTYDQFLAIKERGVADFVGEVLADMDNGVKY